MTERPSAFARAVRRIGRALAPLFDPDGAERRAREAEVVSRLGDLLAADERVGERLDRVAERVDRVDRRQLEHLREAIAALEFSTRRQRAVADRVLRAGREHDGHELTRHRVMQRLYRLAHRDGRIIVGPWTGEVGFELLYWAPFVRWAVRKFRIDPSRLTIVSRGGTASWYGIEGAQYRDVFEFCPPETFAARTQEAKKQRVMRAFDRELIRTIGRSLGGVAGALHPAMMYAMYMPFWKQKASRRWLDDIAVFDTVRPPAVADLDLPRDYVAVRFYFSACFPDTAENRDLVHRVVHALAARTHVVLLGAGIRVDDHQDVELAGRSGRIHSVAHLMRPETNLAVQTAVIAGARAFVGTYGGYAYLAPLCGVNTVAVYSRRNYYTYHLDFAQQMFEALRAGSLTVIDAAVLPLLQDVASGGPSAAGA